MKHDQLKEQFKKLLRANPPIEVIERLFYLAVEVGNFEVETENEDFTDAKIIWYAILTAMAEQWKPLFDKNREKANQIVSRFLNQ